MYERAPAADACRNGAASGGGVDACFAGGALPRVVSDLSGKGGGGVGEDATARLVGAAPLAPHAQTGAPVLTSPSSFFWDMASAGRGRGIRAGGRGVSWYTRIFGLFQEGYPMADTQMGMGGTWLAASGLGRADLPTPAPTNAAGEPAAGARAHWR
eukprot:gene6773-4111_t